MNYSFLILCPLFIIITALTYKLLFFIKRGIYDKKQQQKKIRCSYEKFLEYISMQKVEMSSMASSLIRSYFVASRQERPESLPIRSIKIMTRMAESSARINLRQEVLHEDALVAAFLYEETLATLFGPSIYSPPLDRNLGATDRLIDIVKKTDEAFMKFSLWLDQYMKTLTSSTGNNSLLEF